MMMQHTFSCGATYVLKRDIEITLSYSHAFKKEITGDFSTVANIGNVPTLLNGTVTNEVYANLILAGITKKW